MNRLRPTSDFMIVETYKDIQESLVLPESTKGELFRVLDVGPGYTTNTGKLIRPAVKSGDIVALVGNYMTIPFQGERYNIARSGDVIAYYRPDKFEKFEDMGIPDKI